MLKGYASFYAENQFMSPPQPPQTLPLSSFRQLF